MYRPQITPIVSGQVVADSTNYATALVTDWMLAAGGTTLTAMQEIRRLTGAGTLTSVVAYRFASVSTERPGNWNNSANERTSADVYGEDISLSGTTDQMWVQLGLRIKNTSGVAECFAKLQAEVLGTGRIVAVQTVDIAPIANSGTSVNVALGKPFGHTGINKLMYAVTFSGVSGTITWRPQYREIKGNPDYPGNWTNLASADQTQSTDDDVNLNSSMTISRTAGYMFAQAGIKFSGDARGTAKIVVAAIN